MTAAEARAMADEQIAWWRRQGISPEDAWRAVGLSWAWGVTWPEVRGEMVRWAAGTAYRSDLPFKVGALPPAPARLAA